MLLVTLLTTILGYALTTLLPALHPFSLSCLSLSATTSPVNHAVAFLPFCRVLGDEMWRLYRVASETANYNVPCN